MTGRFSTTGTACTPKRTGPTPARSISPRRTPASCEWTLRPVTARPSNPSRATRPTPTASTGSHRFWCRRTTPTAYTSAATASSSPTTGAIVGASPTISQGHSTRTASRSWGCFRIPRPFPGTTAHRAMARSRRSRNLRSRRASCGPARTTARYRSAATMAMAGWTSPRTSPQPPEDRPSRTT